MQMLSALSSQPKFGLKVAVQPKTTNNADQEVADALLAGIQASMRHIQTVLYSEPNVSIADMEIGPFEPENNSFLSGQEAILHRALLMAKNVISNDFPSGHNFNKYFLDFMNASPEKRQQAVNAIDKLKAELENKKPDYLLDFNA